MLRLFLQLFVHNLNLILLDLKDIEIKSYVCCLDLPIEDLSQL